MRQAMRLLVIVLVMQVLVLAVFAALVATDNVPFLK
jgi:hypothetical protein